MHVNAKKMAVSGLLMALAVIFIILSGILDFNTLFFLAAAAFFVGIIIREFGLRYGAAYFIGCLVLGVLLAPQKLYCITSFFLLLYLLFIKRSYISHAAFVSQEMFLNFFMILIIVLIMAQKNIFYKI